MEPQELQELNEEEQPELVLSEDGFLYDAETGEVHSYARKDPDWQPETADQVDYCLELMQAEDANVMAYDERIRLVTRNLQKMRNHHVQRRAWLERRFAAAIIKFAHDQLEAKNWKDKTYQFAFGKVAFRKGSASVEITDMGAAVEWAEEHAPTLVRIKKDVLKSELAKCDLPEDCTFFERRRGEDSVTIDTGVGK